MSQQWGEATIGLPTRDAPSMLISEQLQRLLRQIALGDESTLRRVGRGRSGIELDPKTNALVVIAALVAIEADLPSYQSAIDHAHAAGASDDDILETIVAIAPLVGAARVRSAVANIEMAL